MVAVIADAERWNRLQHRAQEARIVPAFELFRQADVEPILIKGWAAARYYPKARQRRPGDIDLAVAPEQFSEASALLKRSQIPGLIDLHDGLRHLDALP